MEEARTLSLEECLHHDGRKIWLETMDQGGQTVPVCFYAERIPFLKFDAQDRVLMIEVRGSCYGETWRCWDRKPETTDWVPDREKKFEEILASVDAGKRAAGNAKKPAAKKKPAGR